MWGKISPSSSGRYGGYPVSSENRASGEYVPRIKLRFPIETQVCYQCMKRGRISAAGVGKTYEVSSREVHFTTQACLKQGETVRLAMEWPAVLDNTCLMKLDICGSVIRSLPGAAAIKISRYEFRTRGAALKVVSS